MSIVQAGIEVVGAHNIGFPRLDASQAGNYLRTGGIITAGIAGAFSVLSAFKAHHQVEQGYVAIRLSNGRAYNKSGEPAHELLYPGSNWVVPYYHGVELINIQRQTKDAVTCVDLGEWAEDQYDIQALATWGVITSPNGKGGQPVVDFKDAYNFYYGIDSMEDLEEMVATTAMSHLCTYARQLPEDQRTNEALANLANENVGHTNALEQYGVRIYDFAVSRFARAGVINIASPLQVQLVAAPEEAI